ncbi:hypothetical protein FO519_006553 [Halicephalobus sp. NKZ332]|nr:hypothetical protein FO519_006553 [Halicephalobus sp. NKZ332]
MSVYLGTYKDPGRIQSLLYGNFFSLEEKHIAVAFPDRLEFWKINQDNSISKECSFKVSGVVVCCAVVKFRPTDQVHSIATLDSNNRLLIHSIADDFSQGKDGFKVRIRAELDSTISAMNTHGPKMFALGKMDELVIHFQEASVEYCTWTVSSNDVVKFQSFRQQKGGLIRDIAQLGGDHFSRNFLLIVHVSQNSFRGIIVKPSGDELKEDEKYPPFDIASDYNYSIPYYGKEGGAIMIGRNTLTVCLANAAFSSDLDISGGRFSHVVPFVNPQSFLAFTAKGKVGLIQIETEGGELTAVDFDIFASIPRASHVVALDDQKYFVAGDLCDHSLVQFIPGKEEGQIELKVLGKILNSAPIIDVLAIEDRCDRRLVVSTGGFSEGKLVIIKDGMKLNCLTSIPQPTEPVIYQLHKASPDPKGSLFLLIHDNDAYYLSVSPGNLKMVKQEESPESLPIFQKFQSTSHISCINGNFFVQINSDGFYIWKNRTEIVSGPGSSCGHANNFGFICIAEGEMVRWYYFDQKTEKLILWCQQRFLKPVQAVRFVEPDNEKCTLCVVFLQTENEFYLVDIEKSENRPLKFATICSVPGEIFTDVTICRFAPDATFLFVSTDLGKLEYFVLDEDTGKVKYKKPIHIGVRPLKFCKVIVKDQLHVLICSDQVSVVRYEAGALTFCHLDVKELNSVFNLEHFGDMLLYHKENELSIGVIPGKQTKSFVPIHIGETIEKMHYDKATNMIIAAASNEMVIGPNNKDKATKPPSVITAFEMAQTQPWTGGDISEPSIPARYYVSAYSLVALDGDRYMPIGVVHMALREEITCIVSGTALGKNFIIVGTGIAKEHTDKMDSGRLLLYEVNRPTSESNVVFKCVAEKICNGGIIAAKISKKNVIRVLMESQTMEFVLDEIQGNFDVKNSESLGNCVYSVTSKFNSTGDLLIYSDVLNPVSLIRFFEDAPQERICSSFDYKFMFNMDFLTRHYIIGFSNNFTSTVFTDLEAENEGENESTFKLRALGTTKVGYIPNNIRSGTPFLPIFYKNTTLSKNARYFGTICGAIGVIIHIEPQIFKLLKNAEICLANYFNDGKNMDDSVPFVDGDYLSRMLNIEDVEKVFEDVEIPDGIQQGNLKKHLVIFKYARELWKLHL